MRFVPSQQLNVNFYPHYVPCDFFVENVSVLLGQKDACRQPPRPL